MERTEDDKLCRSPLNVVFGGKTCEIRILPIRESREWRAEFAKALAQIPKWVNVTTDEPADFEKAMNAMLIEVPNLVGDLFFAYAKDLNREEIEGIATDDELAKAFQEIAAFALPLTGSLVQAMTMGTPSGPVKPSSTS